MREQEGENMRHEMEVKDNEIRRLKKLVEILSAGDVSGVSHGSARNDENLGLNIVSGSTAMAMEDQTAEIDDNVKVEDECSSFEECNF